MLLREVEVGVRDLRGEQQSVVFQAPRLAELLESLRTEHLSQGIGRVDRTVDEDVGDMDALGCELGVQRLAEHAPPTHRGCRNFG